MEFIIVQPKQPPSSKEKDKVYLEIDLWNDFHFITQFYMTLYDIEGNEHRLGNIKIGFKGQEITTPTYRKIPKKFTELSKDFFSLSDSKVYKTLAKRTDKEKLILKNLNDIVANKNIINEIKDERVFNVSLLRDTSISAILGQYSRLLEGKTELTNYNFKFDPAKEKPQIAPISFEVEVGSTPGTNIHAIIGRNGVGKTTLLNSMTTAITDRNNTNGVFLDSNYFDEQISASYFSSLVTASFSAFDPFIPPKEQLDPARGTRYIYLGLKDKENPKINRNIESLHQECIESIIYCLSKHEKTERWREAILKLSSDGIFFSLHLDQLETYFKKNPPPIENPLTPDSRLYKHIKAILTKMSSGHSLVLLTITRLVETVEEKTLVLLDEPESHLHPPLLSAFIRALSELLLDRNGAAIIATHSPVVLQEIPKSCVWKIYRQGDEITFSRPNIETFAENVGILTKEIFGLEVEQSGFHELLVKSTESGHSYHEILEEYKNQLGNEGRAILSTMIAIRDKTRNHD